MALPKLATNKYELTLPSTGEKVEYRPFLVKEEKLLLTAQSAGTERDQINAIKEIVRACTFDKLDADKIAFFDLEYVFLQLRAKSVGESAKIEITCPDDGESKVIVTVNLTDIECKRSVEHNDKIELTDGVGMIMQYPKVDIMVDAQGVADDPNKSFDIIKKCIGQIYDAENVYDRADMDEKELDEFIESMSHEQFTKMQTFFETMPRVKHSVKVKNPNTGVESEVVLEGMASFF